VVLRPSCIPPRIFNEHNMPEKCPALQRTATVIENVPMARDTWRLRITEPDIAGAIRPGQFLMLRILGTSDPLLGRPYALYDAVLDSKAEPCGLDIVYLVVGKQTRALTQLRSGDPIGIWGPLGNGFPDLDGLNHVWLVAGGIGQTPFLAYLRQLLGTRGYGGEPARKRVEHVTLFYGARTADLLAGVDDFQSAGATVHVATDDGSTGFHGYVTQLVAQHSGGQHIIGCGPGPMMHALAKFARVAKIPCHLSLETPMACGVGICFSCVTRVRDNQGWDYRRVCVEGPVFDAATLELE
jgi:dihydroorotate dehydrogenase electron transfer subunit